MEPSLKRKEFKNQKKIIIIVSIFVISLFIGSSFSLLSSSDEVEVVSFKTGDLNMEVKTTGTLSLEGELPKSYEDGFKSNDITLTLTNTGSLEIGKYEVKLEGDSSTTLEANYIMYSVSEDNGKTYLASRLLSETNNIIYTGYSLKDNKVLKLKIWIDEAAGANALKKIYNGNINVELYQNEDTIVDVVKSKLVSNYSGSTEDFNGGLVAVNNDGDLYHETNNEEIREYRYSGPNVNNYVTFNDELWRIIGVFSESNEEFVKIVRNDILNSNYLPEKFNINDTQYSIHSAKKEFPNAVYWHGSKYINDWTTAGLQYYLNNQVDNTNINKGYLNFISKEYEDMIRVTTYYLGNDTETVDNEVSDTAISSYINEHDVTNIIDGNKATWKGKIGLMYPSDYGYSVNKKNWENLTLYNYEKVFSNSWMSKMTSANLYHTWFISPHKDVPHASLILLNNGTVTATSTYNTGSSNDGQDVTVRPCLYLKSNVKITSGTGEQTNPYKLSLD